MMRISTQNAHTVVLDSTGSDDVFSVKWNLSELKCDKPVKVFSIFSCCGGSSMGYKRAGFKVIGNCEIDDKINRIYVANHHPKYNFNMDVREFLKQDLPEELIGIDILDGSPPCTTFSMAGKREDSWGEKKKFREGQTSQTLDDLFFVFLDVVEKLQPKIVVAENVVGLVQGNARGYVNQIIKRFKELGYDVQLFKLNAAFMEVPQARERVFFIANRLGLPKLELRFNYPAIPFGEVRTAEPGREMPESSKLRPLLDMAKPGEKDLSKVSKRLGGKSSYFNWNIIADDAVAPTICAGSMLFRGCDKTYLTKQDIITVQTFPQDFDFLTEKEDTVLYACGMSVPPNMMAHIAHQIWQQWLKDGVENG